MRLMKRQDKKRITALAVISLVALGALIIAVFAVHHNRPCVLDDRGECLPAGKCVAPNDAIVDCTQLNSDGSYKEVR